MKDFATIVLAFVMIGITANLLKKEAPTMQTVSIGEVSVEEVKVPEQRTVIPREVPREAPCSYGALIAKYFPQEQWSNTCRIMKAESEFDPNNTHNNTDGSIDRGLMQINSVHSKRVNGDLESLFDPDTNVRIAREIWGEQGWSPWVAAKKLGIK